MIIVHGRANSTNVQKVLWLFDEIGLAFERIDRGGRFGGLDDPAYRALNPNGLVPAVIDGDLVMWESQAILRHYARQNPGAGLFPSDPADALRSDMLLDWNITTLWPPLRVVYVGTEREGKALGSAEMQQGLDKLLRPLDTLEGLLTGRDYIGGSFGIGDIPAAISLSRWLFLGRDLAAWPAVEAWYRRCAARPAFRNRIVVGG
jgi:glutathione S-transferase